MPQLLAFAEHYNHDLHTDLLTLSDEEADLLHLITRCQSVDMRAMMAEFVSLTWLQKRSRPVYLANLFLIFHPTPIKRIV